jgi:hypothetical protein
MNMITMPSGKDSHIHEPTVPNMHWYVKFFLSPASRLSSPEKAMPDIHRPNYHYYESSHSFTPVLAKFILSSHVDNENRKTSQLEKVVPALTPPITGVMPFVKPFSLKDGLPRKDARLLADKVADTESLSFTTANNVYFSRLVAISSALDYIGSRKERRSKLIATIQARLLSGKAGSNVKSPTILGLVPKWVAGSSIVGATKEVVRHNLIENGIVLRHKRFADNSQKAQARIPQKRFAIENGIVLHHKRFADNSQKAQARIPQKRFAIENGIVLRHKRFADNSQNAQARIPQKRFAVENGIVLRHKRFADNSQNAQARISQKHFAIENGIVLRHKRFADNSQNAQTRIPQKHFATDIPYIRQGSSPLMYATDLPAMVYFVPGKLQKSATVVKTTEKDVKREASSSVPPSFTKPQMSSSKSVAESDLPRLANRVYGLIVERIGREKELGGY